MNAINAIRTGFAKSFQFSGRASRSEFWWFAPVALTIPALIALYASFPVSGWQSYALKVFAVLLALIPFNAALSRRANDAGVPPQEIWEGFCPTIGVFVWGTVLLVGLTGIASIIYWLLGLLLAIPAFLLLIASLVMAPGLLGAALGQLVLPSQPGPNKYGPNPYEVQS